MNQSPPAGLTSESESATDLVDVVLLNRDLFFGVRVANTLRGLGYRVTVCKETSTFSDRVRTATLAPVLGILDLTAVDDWDAIRELTSDPSVETPLLLFGAHKDVAGLRAAKAAGVDRVVSNGDFHREMVTLVRRYARPTGAPSGGADVQS